MIKVISDTFDSYMDLLVFLKDPKSKPIITKLNPKMCLTCWQIFTDQEKASHLQSDPSQPLVKHKITGTFASMKAAEKDSILALSRQWKKTQGKVSDSDERV